MKNYLFILITFLAASCATSPLGRNHLSLMSDSTMDKMGAQSFEETKKQMPVEKNAAINAYVKCVAVPITQVVGNDVASSWEIVTFQNKEPNAFALPGGKIAVQTGILPIAKTDAQLAAVIGHEVGHVIAKHGNERVSEQTVAQTGLAVADFLSGSVDPTKKQLLMAGLGAGAQYGILLPFSRTQESEADLIGLDLMSRAGFDPRQSVELWKNMSALGGNSNAFTSDHPSDADRMANLQAHMDESIAKYDAARKAGKNPHCTPPKM